MDFSSIVAPVTFVDKNKDPVTPDFKPTGKIIADVRADYDSEACHGAPVAVHMVNRRLSEERILAIAEEVRRLLENFN